MKRYFTLPIVFLLLSFIAVPLQSQATETRKVLITEFMAINNNTLIDEDGDFPDWLELHNPGTASLNLAGWYLTDNPGNLTQWILPSIDLAPGGYLVVFASGKDRSDPAQNLHTSFRISGSGEYLAIVEPDGLSISHSYGPLFPAQRADVSYGIFSDQLTYLTDPTPGTENVLGDMVLAPVFSKNRGFYSEAFQVELTVSDPALEIYYSTDGSRPSKASGSLYTSPVSIQTTTPLSAVAVSAAGGISDVITHTYFFTDSIVNQPSDPPGYPADWGDFHIFTQPEPSADYEMDPEVTQDPLYKDMFNDALTSIPTLSIVTDIGNLFSHVEDPVTGGIYIYTGFKGYPGFGWERQVSAEYLEPGNGRQFQINCGLRIQGGNGVRPDNSQKHSFRLVFRSEFGPTRLNFNLFDGRAATNDFNTLILRADYNYSWSHNNITQQQRALKIRDPFAKNTQLDMGQPATHSKYVHLYLNGLYWGIYTIAEKLNNDFMESYLYGTEDDFDVVEDHGDVIDGDEVAWNQTLAMAEAGLSSNAAYQKIQGNNADGTRNLSYPILLDVDNLIDYMILNIYIGNLDWGDNNWIAARNRVDPLYGFRFFSWDAENSLNDRNTNLVDISDGKPVMIYRKLRANTEFKLRFADHLQKHFFNGGALTPEATLARFNELAADLDPAIIAESARWGDYRRDVDPRKDGASLYTRNDHWLVEKQDLENNYFPQRSAIVLQQFKDEGLFPGIDAPEFSQYGGEMHDPITLEITSTEGEIWYSLNGQDPRDIGGAVSTANATLYENPLEISSDVTVKARAKSGSNWSALTEAVFGEDLNTVIRQPEQARKQLVAGSYPNPVSHTANIYYTLPAGGEVEVIIMSLDGRILENLFSGYQPEGRHQLGWQAEGQSSGIYFYRIRYKDMIHTGKLILNR
jgi:hypothetical protein